MRYSLKQVTQFDQTLPQAIPAPTLMVNNGYASLRKLSDDEYIAIWCQVRGVPVRAGLLDTHAYTDLLERLVDHLPDDYGYALAIADYATYQFDEQGQPYLPQSGSDYDFAD